MNRTCPGAHGLSREVKCSGLHLGQKVPKVLLSFVLIARTSCGLSYHKTAVPSPPAFHEGISLLVLQHDQFFDQRSSWAGWDRGREPVPLRTVKAACRTLVVTWLYWMIHVWFDKLLSNLIFFFLLVKKKSPISWMQNSFDMLICHKLRDCLCLAAVDQPPI